MKSRADLQILLNMGGLRVDFGKTEGPFCKNAMADRYVGFDSGLN